STKSCGRRLRSTLVLPISVLMSELVASRMRCTTGYASGCTAEESSGLSPPWIRRKPAHCSNAFGPRRGTFLRFCRARKGLFEFRWVTMVCANTEVIPETRASCGTDAVLTSPTTALTQSSTNAYRERESLFSETSCWYWPTQID